MGLRFSHLSEAERWAIEIKLREGLSYAAIGRALGRHRSTIFHEARRGHWKPFNRYLAEFGRRYYSRKRNEARVARCKLDAQMLKAAWKTVLFGLHQEWSPQQLCERLANGAIPAAHVLANGLTLSHETIYRVIYGMPAGQQHAELVRLLRLSRSGRSQPRKAMGKRFTGLQNMRGIEQRSEAANLRQEPGHWEGDLIKGARNLSSVRTTVARVSRCVMLTRMDNSSAPAAVARLSFRLRSVPPCLLKKLTYDQGTEMALHPDLAKRLRIDIFFCDPHSPWQRGSNENSDGLIREYLPKGMDRSNITHADLTRIRVALNSRPRKMFGFRTPAEVFAFLQLYRIAGAALQA